MRKLCPKSATNEHCGLFVLQHPRRGRWSWVCVACGKHTRLEGSNYR